MAAEKRRENGKILVFRPTLEEFRDFPKYINYMEECGAHLRGIAKIVPPKEYVPRRGGYDDVNMPIPAPISQIVTGKLGIYQQVI